MSQNKEDRSNYLEDVSHKAPIVSQNEEKG
jgi:hypothetical protein